MINFRFIIGSVIFFLCSIAAFIADIILQFHSNSNLNSLTEVLFSSVLILTGIWISCYYLLLQFYKNRYPLEIIKNEFSKTVTTNISNVIYVIIWGSFLMAYGGGLVSQIWFALVSLSITIEILISTYKSNKKLMINTYIDNYTDMLKVKLKNSLLEPHDLDEIFEKMKKTFEECFVKEEYFVCQNISEKTGLIFKSLIIECNKMILEEDITPKDVDYFFNKVISYSTYLIELSKNCNSEYFITSLVDHQKQNINICIETNQLHLFQKYIDEINILIFNLQKEHNQTVVALLFDVYRSVCKKLFTSENDINWYKYLINSTYEITMSLNYIHKDINLKYFADLITYSLVKSLKLEDENIYDFAFDIFRKFTISAAKINHSFDNIVVYYALFSSKILETQIEKIEKYLDLMQRIQSDLIKDNRYLDYIFYLFDITSEKYPDLSEKIRKRNVDILLELISSDINCNNILLPSFKEVILEHQYNIEKIESVCDDFYLLFNKSIVKDNTGIFYLFSQKLNECIFSLESRSKEVQILFFDVYIYLLSKTSIIENKLFMEITFSQLDKCIRELDNNKKISSDFGLYIIKKLTSLATEYYGSNDTFTRKLINFLFSFVDENDGLRFIISNKDKLKLLYKSIFNIGMNSIENNDETSLRSVSNSIGWLIIGSIKRGQGELTKYLIERAVELFMIAKNMNVSRKTLTFIMTLFTTIGTYCCKEANCYIYRNLIVEALINEDLAIIQTAIKLRTSENDVWNDLFENKTEVYTREFFKKITENRRDVKEESYYIG